MQVLPAAYCRRLVALAAIAAALGGAAEKAKIRQPEVAGSFYPANPQELTRMVDGLLARAKAPDPQDTLVALVAPHAGYEYAGAVAAQSYAWVKGRKYARVVVIAPSHVDAFPFSSVYDGDAYATPLGLAPVDKEFARKLAGSNSSIRLSSRGHVIKGPQGEHALEDQLPWLQRTLGDFKVVPVIMGDQSYQSCRALGVALAKLIRNGDTLIVASSDLSHFHSYEQASAMDAKTLRALGEWDYLSMSRNFDQQVWEACGGGPIIAAMIAAERLGANEARVLKYANSGDVTADRTRVVGYGAAVLVKSAKPAAAVEPHFSLTDAEKEELLALARKSVEVAVTERRIYNYPGTKLEALLQERGAFVTLKEKGELRGCIGYVAAMKPLALTVRDVAALAAVKDSRFKPVTPAELPKLEYEVSVLSPLRRVMDVKRIRVGVDGLVVRRGDSEGLLLPQVPVEQHWDRLTFLEQACEKAGLPADAWRDPDTDIFSFTAVVFGPKNR
jgi:AmmeMemoRadiSam system protein B/AmmeMemoRadiSam system protein A